MERNDIFSRIWVAFEEGRIVPACAWCGRVQIDDGWVLPPRVVLDAVDTRQLFSHSICDECRAGMPGSQTGEAASPGSSPVYEW